jgi:predicted ATP-dependent endonuclease of OLD family
MDCNMLIIDEPEINLHPKYQVMIARILAKIVNAGIRLIISTHSDYIIRELNNMIMLSSIKDEETISKLGYTKDEVLLKDDLAPYYFEFQEDDNYVLGKEEVVTKTGFSISEIDKVINSQVETSQNIYEIIEEI